MKSPRPIFSFLCVAMTILLVACSSTGSKPRYPTAHASVAHKLEHGTIRETRDVVIDGQATNMGMIVGAGIGGAVGAIATPIESTGTIDMSEPGVIQVESSDTLNEHRAAMGVGGALGAVVGRQIEKKLSTRKAQELVIELDSGENIVIIQQRREPPFLADERVQVYTTAMGSSRVFHGDEDPFVDPNTNAYIIDDEVGIPLEEPVVW